LPSTSSSPDRPRLNVRRTTIAAGIALVLVVAGVTAFSVLSADESDEEGDACRVDVAGASNPHVGDVAPAFTLPTLDGGCFHLRAERGRPVVVNFWASWCNPCRAEFPLLADAYAKHRGENLEIVGVTHRDIESDSRQFADELDVDWPLAFDDDQRVSRSYGITGIPQTIFVRRDGTISSRIFSELTKEDLDEELREIFRD